MYPEFCKTCQQVKECKQKENMLAGTEPVEGFVDWESVDYYCIDCLGDSQDHQPMLNPELDSPAHCAGCGVPLECQLTTEGVQYVKEAIAEDGGCCRELWPVLFADYLD